MGRLQRLTLAGIVVGAAALRFSTLGLQSLDFDEAYTVGIVGGSLPHAFHQIPLTESTPPLYYVLQWLWSQLFGVGAIELRALSAVLGTLTVGAAFGLLQIVFQQGFGVQVLGTSRSDGVPTWLLLMNPQHPMFDHGRWSCTPVRYPTVRQFAQRAVLGDWTPVVSDVADSLRGVATPHKTGWRTF